MIKLVFPSTTISGNPAIFVAITGLPEAIASTTDNSIAVCSVNTGATTTLAKL